MKVLFLDIDGVLKGHWVSGPLQEQGVGFREANEAYCPLAMERLNRIVEETGCVVVVSSTIRRQTPRGQLQRDFRNAGYRHRLFDYTPVDAGCKWHKFMCSEGHRGGEIGQWMEEARAAGDETIETFAIVDDDSDMGVLKDHLVKTYCFTGLRDEHVHRLIAMLGVRY